MRVVRTLACTALLLTAHAAFAGGSSAPFGYQPDPALKSASKSDLESRIRRACRATQAKLQNVAETRVDRPCGCYAGRVLGELDGGELEAYRNTGVFNDTARAKALAALDGCRLKRPV